MSKKNNKKISEIKWWTPQASPGSTYLRQDPNKQGIQPHRELNPRSGSTFKKPFFNSFTASRKRANFKIVPIDGAQAFKPIGLDRKQLGLEREEGKIVDHRNLMKREATLAKLKYVK